MKVALTGSSGFVGSALLLKLRELKTDVLTVGHRSGPGVSTTLSQLVESNALLGCGVLLHLGARVHVRREKTLHPLEAYRQANVGSTVVLARAAALAGVKRFIFVSSVKVNGESTTLGQPFTDADTPAPQDPYGISKMEAEQGLRQIAAQTGMEVVIIRPPLVYGPGVKANFLAMMRWLSRGIPLPLGAIHNQRSLVALDNLVDLLLTCIDHPAAANQTFLVSDGEDLSTTDLLRRMGRALGKPARLLPVPPVLLKAGAALVGKPELAQRLCGSLQVDISETRERLGWTPPISVDEGLRRAAEGFRREAAV